MLISMRVFEFFFTINRLVKLEIGAPDKNRTRDLRFTKPLLYQLSYKGYLFVAGGILTCFWIFFWRPT